MKLIISALILFCLQVSVFAAPDTARAWQRWEHVLHAKGNYANPYADVTLRVKYTGPGGRTISAYGFWDGGDTFRIRCAFPRPGAWRWETECSNTEDTGLHKQSGRVQVRANLADNQLWKHGFLQVSANKRFLCFADKTPFLWVGDTGWAGPMRSTDEEWEEYLQDRVKKGFSVIQVGLAMWWADKTDRSGNPPFLGEGISQWNPVFWQDYERKIQRANELGLVVLMVGLMEPVDRYPEVADACLFTRNMIARLFGNFMIFSPSFDSNFMPMANEVGRAARDASKIHLITQHPGTPSGHETNDIIGRYRDEDYLDFSGNQSGHNGGNKERCAWQAIEWNLHLYNCDPPKPVINLEAMYETGTEAAFNVDDARSLGWRSWLSGAMGYTYGSDLYNWDTDDSKISFWRTQMNQPGSEQMKYLRDFFNSIQWWKLEPHHERVLTRFENAVSRVPLAMTSDHKLIVAYFPTEKSAEIDLNGLSDGQWNVTWYNPRTGDRSGDETVVAGTGKYRATPPQAGDWILLLTK